MYYTIRRNETFKRYLVVIPVPPNPTGANSGALPLPTQSTAAQSNAASVAPSGPTPGPSASSSTATTGDVVALGSFQVHEFDKATVAAGFTFSTLKNNSFSSQQKTNQDGTTSTIAVLSNSQRGQFNVLLGVDYYFKPKDTFPGVHHGPSDWFGILGGVSLNSLNNYFLGLACEPELGFNFGVGAHFGTETTLQKPFELNGVIPTSTVPTYERRATGLFFMAGFDLHIFRKIFGKVTGVGTSASTTGP